MSLSQINFIISENKIKIHFSKMEKSKNITFSPVTKKTAVKASEVLRKSGYLVEIHGKGPKVHIIAISPQLNPLQKKFTGLDPSLGLDSSIPSKKVELIAKKAHLSPCTYEDSFRKSFSWFITRRGKHLKETDFTRILCTKDFIYNKDGFPQFNEKWELLISLIIHIAVKNIPNAVPAYIDDEGKIKTEIYLEHAQILLDRFLNRNPTFKGVENRLIHFALMIQTVALAIKVDEDHRVFNSDIALALNPLLQKQITADLKNMELLFLKGIKGDIYYTA